MSATRAPWTTTTLAAFAAATGCGDNWAARPDGPPPDTRPTDAGPPEPPPLGEMVDRAGRPLTAELLIGAGLADADRQARQAEYARTGPLEWFKFETEIQRSLALYDGLDSELSAGDRCRPAAQLAQLARILADDRLFLDAPTAPCAPPCLDYLEVERSRLRPSPTRRSGGGLAPTYDAVDITYTALVKDADPGPLVPPVTDGVEAHGDVSSDSFPFLAPPHR
jgi:hypothetical protein